MPFADEVALLERLIAADTHNPGGDERALAEQLAGELRARGGDVELVDVPRATDDATPGAGAYVFARWGRPRWLVNAHLDTVPPNRGWTGDPFRARVERQGDARVVGLGACDTKAAIAAILCALDDARPSDAAVLFSGDEERRSTCMRAFLASGRARSGGANPYEIERAVVCEPTSLRPGTRHRGILTLEATYRGRGGHSSRADELPAPLAELARVASACHAFGVERRSAGPEGFRGLCLNVAKLDGGVAFNVVPDEARLTVSLRPPPGADVASLRDELQALVRAHAPEASATFVLDNPPFQTRAPDRFRPLVGDRAPIDLGFWTEAALLSQAGIDAVVIGPGDIAHAHAPDEHVLIAELKAARALFAAAFAAAFVGEAHGDR
jgi:acetylornithine deacetylase